MRRFRFSSWKFMLLMFVLIAIFFYDLGYKAPDKAKATKETNNSSATPEENEIDVMDFQ